MKDFETRLERLEALAADIKRDDIKIEDAIKDFEEGIKLARGMTSEIDAIEGKIQILMNDPLAGGESKSSENADDAGEGKGDKHSTKTSHGTKRAVAMPELSLFTDADATTGTSGMPESGTRQ